ncbi:MAG TPA: glycosyl hydrolase family 18 protein [Bryobacteraceae bacterium]|nr:glycosyl hydrolase family 18 protein [Bryobacteraceae bacterium]
MSRSPVGIVVLTFAALVARAQTVPMFQHTENGAAYSIAGQNPAQGGTTRIPVIIIPVALQFVSHSGEALDATSAIAPLLRSPLFVSSPFPGQASTQYADGMLRASFSHPDNWHTLLAKSDVLDEVTIQVPPEAGYLLTSRRGGKLGIADIAFVQRELFKKLPKHPGSLLLAVTNNTAYYVEGDATICCTWGTHGVDEATGNSFVLASYLNNVPAIVQDRDVQPLTEQMAEFVNDPLHDPLTPFEKGDRAGNKVPRWLRPASMHPGDQGPCGGGGIATPYFLLEPTDTNRKNNLPYSKPLVVTNGTSTSHVQNVALLPWYWGTGRTFSFPDAAVLAEPAKPCPPTRAAPEVKGAPKPRSAPPNGHSLIGYWTGSDRGRTLALTEVSPQWDVVIVAFGVPDHHAPEGTLRFDPPNGITPVQFKASVASLKREGRRVLLSLGGGGQLFTLDQAASIPVFVSCVTRLVRDYGFDGIDLDFETPSLMLAPGDHDFRHPTTPGIVNLIAALRQLKAQLGSSFLISLVPEGPQMVAGHVSYGGQFGSYLPIAYGIRDILTFIDVQDYNTPPLEGLDGEIYQAGSVNYHAAMTELVLQGFRVGGQELEYPAIPEAHVAVGFYVEETDVATVAASMRYLIGGERPPEAAYALRNARGYPSMIGAMFWNIEEDRSAGYAFSDVIGPLLHSFPVHRSR